MGAGPTGLVLALWLTRLGIPVRIVDKAMEPGTTSRALAVQVRTLELYGQLGIAEEVQGLRQRATPEQGNALSVLMELQADCLAGVWAHHADRQRQLLEAGDVEEGLRAAAAIGDDTIQRRSQGHVVPESWTHGSSAQRVQWFRQGLSSGRVDQCDTFRAARR